MVCTRDDVIVAVSSRLVMFPDVELCILYGSANQDRLAPHSDIDLAVASAKGLTSDLCVDIVLKVGEETDREVSVIDMEKMHGLILQEVLVKGHTILCKNVQEKVKYILRMLEYTEDILPYQTMGLERQRNTFIHG
jgi:predicted nucleotidyltransferase